MNNVNSQDISTLKNFFLDFIFPPTCVSCNNLINSKECELRSHRPALCSACKDKIQIQTGFACAFCQAAVINGMTCPFCRRDHSLSQLMVVANYEQPIVKDVIKNLKYSFIQSLAEDITPLMANYLKKQIERNVVSLANAIIVPVPLSGTRLRWRGFNQAELLAQSLSQILNIETVGALIRIKNSKPQADIQNKEERIANIDSAFTCINQEIVQNKTVLLIDDVSTTGSTLEQCARVLKSAGALKITGFVFARG